MLFQLHGIATKLNGRESCVRNPFAAYCKIEFQ